MLSLIAVLVFVCVCLSLLWATRGLRAGTGPGAQQAPSKPGYFERWEITARQAGLPWRRTIYYNAAVAGLALSVALALLDHVNGAFLAAVAGFVGPQLYVQQLAEKRRLKFAQQLPQALMMAASVLRSGGSLLQAVEAVAADMPDPMGAEFREIQARMRLHVPAHEAMAEVQSRMNVREFAAVIAITRITTEVGGNLPHMYDQVAHSVIEAENAQRTVRAFTTEGRMSTNIVAALPFVVMSLVQLLAPEYFSILFGTWPGRAVLLFCVGMIATGWLVVRKMVDIRVY